MNPLRKYLTEIVLIAGILVVFSVTACINDAYVSRFSYNASRLILQPAAILGIFALGAAVVIIAGGIDLSSGSMIAFSSSIACLSMLVMANWLNPDAVNPTADIPGWVIGVAIAITLAVSLLIGTLHTWLITVVRLPPFVATLASLVGLRSLAIIMNKAVTAEFGTQTIKVNIQDPKFYALGDNIWISVTVFLVIALVLYVILNHTVLGRHLYAMGGNEEAARLSGIRTDRLKWFAYCFASFTAAVAGNLFASLIQQSDPESQGVAQELFAIAAAVIGGCSLAGGIGRVSGVVLGAVFLRVVIDAVAKLIPSASDDFKGMIVGLLVVLAVAFNQLTDSREGFRKQFFPGWLGGVSIFTIGLLSGAVLAFSLEMSGDAGSWKKGLVVGLAIVGLLTATKFFSGWMAAKSLASKSQTG